MFKKIVKAFSGDPVKKIIAQYADEIAAINDLETQFEALSDQQLADQTNYFRMRLAQGETLDDILPEAFATVREVSKRTIGLRHYDVQLIGGIALHDGTITEMRTGEGKTLSATLPLYLNALAINPQWEEKARLAWGDDPEKWQFIPIGETPVGLGVHLVTVNDYLARRDARWMARIYTFLGLSVGVLQMAARTENGKQAFLVDWERTSPHEDQHHLRMVPRSQAYAASIVYGTNNEFGFDYLRDNMTYRLEERVQRGHYFAIIDEVDNVLIDEARTPLIISGPAEDNAKWYLKMAQVVPKLKAQDYEVDERDRTVTLTEIGETHVEEILNMPLRDPERPEDITPEQARMMGYLEQALRAQHLFQRNKDYLVQAGKVVIVDEFTGRLMPGRRWSDGLHQAVEAKEGVRVQSENVTYATITIQNYFRMYEKLSGMTGTAETEAEEFSEIYDLEVAVIPTNLEYQASIDNPVLLALQGEDEEGYRYTYYVNAQDSQALPVFWKRKDYPDMVYRTEEAKFRAIMWEVLRLHVAGRPVLIGTTSVELSERISARLKADPLRRLTQVKLLRAAWMQKNDLSEDGRAIPELAPLNQPLAKLQTATMRQMAREVGISFNPESEENIATLCDLLSLPPGSQDRLRTALKAGIPHQVLNARRHTEESQIIAGAGAFGAVTIATNMAGRGVDIKLGGELAEEVLAITSRVLKKNGHPSPYDLSLEERHQALLELSPENYGIYGSEIKYFLNFMEEMERVQALGGLHVIGSERHESRRIDNQLRGRAARQGDPGSSRFYLSLEDELMRLFGGQQVDGLMQRLKIDDAMPIEAGIVAKIIEQAQTRVEGANFDTRKHLLEYDDVLNAQREKIYNQRDLIFTKEDLSEDILEMLQDEVQQRVPLSLEDPEGPWKLLAWLDQIQPSIRLNEQEVFPSFTISLLMDYLETEGDLPPAKARQVMLELSAKAIQTERDHLIDAVNKLLDSSLDSLESQLKERSDVLDTFIEGLALEEDVHRKPAELLTELSTLLRMPIKLSTSQIRDLQEDPDEVLDLIESQVEKNLSALYLARLVGAVERRLEEPLGLQFSVDNLRLEDWDVLGEQVLEAVQQAFNRRQERYIGAQFDGAIAKDLDSSLKGKPNVPLSAQEKIELLLQMPFGSRATFDNKTHRRVWQRTIRLTYVFLAAQLLEDQTPRQTTNEVLDHLEKALDAINQNNTGESLTPVYRQLLLSVISQLWVDYLTQMEALRISISLEAYGQRDPLVQYKAKSFEMFNQLLKDIRTGVITRMFTYRPQALAAAQIQSQPSEEDQTVEQNEQTKPKKKRKRRRRR